MPCYKPLKAFRTPTGVVFHELSRYDILGRIDIPCGQCIGCRMRRASDWELRIMHEAKSWPDNCFVTLTYARDSLPADGSLDHRDWQLFMKRLRKHVERPVRFYMCGEYGDLNQRPHFHACLFNVDFRSDRVQAGKSASGALFFESATLSRLWGLGRCSVQDLTKETASYCARYVMKKALGKASDDIAAMRATDDGVIRRPEYAAMSLKPGIGFDWFKKYGSDVYPHDYVVAGGTKRRPPRYYDRLLERADRETMEDVAFAREERARVHFADNTDDRLRVREAVHLAGVSNLKRSLES